MTATPTFSSLQLHASLQQGLKELGFSRPTPIQGEAIPPALEGNDLLACAMTGSGKTYAFLLPILHQLLSRPRGATRALVLTPTRELAAQILESFNDVATHTPLSGAAVFGGVGMGPQEHAFRTGVDVLIATPGRLLDHFRQPYAKLDKLEYLVLDVEALIPRVAVDAEKLKTYYEQNVARYTSAEQRQASHILITFPRDGNEDARKAARGKAEGLLAQIRSGGDFGTLAKAQSQDPGSASRGGDLGYFDREMMVKPFADATWNLKLNEVSGLVESEFGYHIIKLTGVKPGVQRPYESVRAEIEQEYRRQEAGREFAKAAEQFTNLVYEQADSLKPAAERFKLEVRTMEGLTRGGPPPSASGQKSPLSNAKLLGELFSADSLKSRRNTDAVEVSTNMLVSARIVDYMPAQRKPLEAVKTEVQQRIVARESSRLAMEAGETRLKELTSGGADTGFGPAQTVRRSDGAQSKIPSAALEKIFKAPTSKLPRFVGVDLGAEGYGLYELRSVTAATQAQIDAKRPMYEEQFAQFVSQQEVAAYLESLKARAKVKKNPTAIAKKD